MRKGAPRVRVTSATRETLCYQIRRPRGMDPRIPGSKPDPDSDLLGPAEDPLYKRFISSGDGSLHSVLYFKWAVSRGSAQFEHWNLNILTMRRDCQRWMREFICPKPVSMLSPSVGPAFLIYYRKYLRGSRHGPQSLSISGNGEERHQMVWLGGLWHG